MQGKSQLLQQNSAAVGIGTPIVLTGAFASITVQVWGTFVGTVNFEVTMNGTDWLPALGATTSTTAPGIFYFTVNNLMQFRANITSYTSGNINAFANASEEALGEDGGGGLANPSPIKIADIPFGSFAANTTYAGRYTSVTSRNARARYFLIVNKLNQASNGNVYLVGFDSIYPKPTYAYSGSLSFGSIGASNGVSTYYGSVNGTAGTSATQPFGPTDSIELQFPMGATAPTSGNVEVWMVELK